MIGFPFYDPARPPPPLVPPSDEQLVDQFLRARPARNDRTRHKPSSSTSSISEMKAKLHALVAELDQLRSHKESLEKEMHSLPDLEWRTEVDQLTTFQANIDRKLAELPELGEQLQRKLATRRKKRAWLRRRNAKLKDEKLVRVENRTQLHAAIDRWQQEQRKILEKEKRAQQELDYASHFLADVHRRKAAAKRYLAKFEKIKESRKNRGDGEDVHQDLDELSRTWNAKLSECVKEERKLKDVLARQSAANFQRRVENEWNRVLFGDTIPKRFEHPLLAADRSREALVATRWAWDACLDEGGGSAIPLGWVLPPRDPGGEWAEYQAKELS